MAGLYSPVILGQHGTAASNISNILSQGFKSGNLSWADLLQGGGRKVFTSTSPNLVSQYGDDVIDVITSAKNLRSLFGGGFTSKSIGFGDEIASTIAQANKGMKLAQKLRSGIYANSPLARRLLQKGTNVGATPSWLSKFLPWMARTAMSAPAAGLTTLFQSTPANAGEQEFMDAINEQQAVMAAGQQALGQTQPQIQAQQAASQATQQGNYQAPTMTQQQMVQEAIQTGGTVNPHEATQAVYVPPPRQPVSGPHGGGGGGGRSSGGGGGGSSGGSSGGGGRPPGRPRRGPHGAQGGMVSMNYLTRRL